MARRKRPPKKERKANLRDLSQPLRELTYEVFRDNAGMRLDQFCAERLPWRSKTHLQRWISEEKITIQGRGRCKKSTKVQNGIFICSLLES